MRIVAFIPRLSFLPTRPDRAAEAMLARHRAEDARPLEPTPSTKDRARVEQ
jgi:hypothetical protein